MRNQVLLATASTVAFAGAANAQPPAPVFSWTGFYVGANLGAAFQHTDVHNIDDYSPNGSNYTSPFFSSNGAGPSYGAQFGYNYQISQIVVGIEADLSGTNVSKTFTPPNDLLNQCGSSCRVTATNELNFLSTVRGRVGVAFNQFMVFGTGGFAAGKVSNSWGYNFASPFHFEEVRAGYVWGGGVEYMIMPKITLRAEALHVDLGTTRSTVINNSTSFNTDFRNSANIGRVALNFVW